MTHPFWSDEFDVDLLKVIPGALEALGHLADVPLWTHGGETGGRLNHPSVWHASGGQMIAFFGADANPTHWQPEAYWTAQPVIRCTWLEALRDAWAHQYLIVVNGVATWNGHEVESAFMDLLYHVRGWRPLEEDRAAELREGVRLSLERGTAELGIVLDAIRHP